MASYERKSSLPPLVAYGVAVVAAVAATLIRQALQPWLGTATPYAVHFLAIMFAAAYGGLGPGLLAVALSAVLGWYLFVYPVKSFQIKSISDLIGACLFTATGCALAWISDTFRSARLKAQASVEEAQFSAERFRTTLASIGDAVIVTTADGSVAFMNPVAESLTGWTFQDASGKPLGEVFRIVNEFTRAVVENPATKVIREGSIVGLANHTVLISRRGVEIPIDDSGAPIRDAGGKISGIVMVFRDVTERRRAERERAAAAERFRTTLASIGDAVIVTAADGSVAFMNPVAESLTGWTFPEASGKSLTDIFHIVNEFTRAAVESPVTKVMREGVVVGLANHTVLISHTGGEIPIDDSAAPIRDADGSTGGIVMVFRDVTERRRAEQQRGQLAAIVQSSDDAIIGKNLDGTITSWNSGAERMYGYTKEEVLGHPINMLAPHGQFNEFPEIMDRLRRGERVEHYETKRRRKDGTVIDVAVSVSPIRSQAGDITGASAVARDITERKRAEHQRAQLAAIVESSDDAMLGKDLDGIITSWNPGAERMYGYTKEEALGRPVTMLAPPGQFNEIPEIMDRLRRGESIDHYETKRLRKDGAVIDVSVTISPIRSQAGEIVGASAVARDITERKRAEEERAALLEREKTARAEAETANRLKDEFLATLSHELRTPLQAILGFSRLLGAGRLKPPDATQAIQTIERNAEAQAALIEDLLDVSRIITGNVTIDIRPQEFAPIAQTALESVRPAALAKGVSLSVSIDTELGMVPVDANRIRQAIWNLLSNSVKFTPRGGQVSLRVTRAGSSAQIAVSDTGIGIAPEFLPHVFERFRQAQASTTRSHGGLGLGLSIVRHIVEMHGGTVEAESEGVGRGATFRMNLPLRGIQVPAIQPRREVLYGSSVAPSPKVLNGLVILAVDDQPDSRDLLTVSLQHYGATVVTAESAGAALDILRKSVPDVLVSDIGMPGEDGLSLIRKVRALDGTPSARIRAIALTGFASASDRSKAEEAGFQMHVAKPVDPMALVMAVAKVTGRV